ncbi:MAG: hypothetical protein U0Q16_31000 [Bryobacteraceae bacterium]
MRRRTLLAVVWAASVRAEQGWSAIRGKLTTGKPARLVSAQGAVELTGDEGTLSVLADGRLKDKEVEAVGETVAGGQFRILPIHKKGLFVLEGGKRLMISYWCAVCSIRTYTPGVCMCCQDETALDLKEKFEQ